MVSMTGMFLICDIDSETNFSSLYLFMVFKKDAERKNNFQVKIKE